MGVFGPDRISGDAIIRFGKKGETFIEIEGKEPTELRGEETKVTERTRNIMLMALGTKDGDLAGAANLGVEYVIRHCGGEGKIGKVL